MQKSRGKRPGKCPGECPSPPYRPLIGLMLSRVTWALLKLLVWFLSLSYRLWIAQVRGQPHGFSFPFSSLLCVFQVEPQVLHVVLDDVDPFLFLFFLCSVVYERLRLGFAWHNHPLLTVVPVPSQPFPFFTAPCTLSVIHTTPKMWWMSLFLFLSLTRRFSPWGKCPFPTPRNTQRLNLFPLDNFWACSHLSLGAMEHLTKLDTAGTWVDVKRAERVRQWRESGRACVVSPRGIDAQAVSDISPKSNNKNAHFRSCDGRLSDEPYNHQNPPFSLHQLQNQLLLQVHSSEMMT